MSVNGLNGHNGLNGRNILHGSRLTTNVFLPAMQGPAASPSHHQHPLHQDRQRVPDKAWQWVPVAQAGYPLGG